jgi:ribosomal protein L19
MNLIQTLEAEAIQQFAATKTIPEFRPGDTLRVGVRVVVRRAHPLPEIRGRLHRPLEHVHRL